LPLQSYVFKCEKCVFAVLQTGEEDTGWWEWIYWEWGEDGV